MTEAMLHYATDRFESVIEALLNLPETLRPNRFRRDEGAPKPKDVVTDIPRFRAFLDKGLDGAFLYAEAAIYGFVRVDPNEFYIYVTDLDAQDADSLLQYMGSLSGGFGYAADIGERHHRNRLVKKTSYGIDEAWVGRDWHRYLPGLYWLTIIPESLAKRHGIPLETLKNAAIVVEEMVPGVWLLKYFDAPDHWRVHAEKLDLLCEETPGVFAISAVRPAFEEATTFLDASEVLRDRR